MTTGDDTVVKRYADMMERKGELITLRRVARLAGSAPLPNPPVLADPVLDGNVLVGATTIAIRADQATGRILAGDRLTIGSLAPSTVAFDVASRGLPTDPHVMPSPGFDAVMLTAPLAQAATDGTPIVPSWAADTPVWAAVQSFPLALQNDQRIAGDYNVILAAYGVDRPRQIDQIIIEEIPRQIVSVDQLRYRGQVVAWTVHAR